MNEIVKNSIDARRNAIFSSYNITDEGILLQIDNYFKKLEKFGEKYDDIMKFEEDLAKDPLTKEYTDLFIMISGYMNPTEEVDEGQEMMNEMADDAKRYVRRTVKEKAASKARGIPIVGDIMEAKQYADLFGVTKDEEKKTNYL